MIGYSVDDSLDLPLTTSVEVTVHFSSGDRWLFFCTPDLLSSVGDYVDETDVRVHLGEKHMIVVSGINQEVIDRVLRSLWENGELEERTIPL